MLHCMFYSGISYRQNAFNFNQVVPFFWISALVQTIRSTKSMSNGCMLGYTFSADGSALGLHCLQILSIVVSSKQRVSLINGLLFCSGIMK